MTVMPFSWEQAFSSNDLGTYKAERKNISKNTKHVIWEYETLDEMLTLLLKPSD